MKNGKATAKNATFLQSSAVAARGFILVFRSEKKVRLALTVAIICTIISVWLKATRLESILVLFSWVQVMVGEIFNTSLEKAMDYACDKEFHPLIKRGKDYAAASVFVLSVSASIFTLYIFFSKYF